MAIYKIAWKSVLSAIAIISILCDKIQCEQCRAIFPPAGISSSSLEVEFNTVEISEHSYELTANFTWKHPEGSGYDKFIVRAAIADHEAFVSSIINCDDTYTYVTDAFALFSNLRHGSSYVFQVGLYDSTSHGATLAKSIRKQAPDCYVETSDLSYCASKDIATIGVPVDVRIEDIIKYETTTNRVTLYVTWRRPVQINGTLTVFLLNIFDMQSVNRFNKYLSVSSEYAEGPDVTFFRNIPDIVEGIEYMFSISAYVSQEGLLSAVRGPEYQIPFLATPTTYVTAAPPPDIGDSETVEIVVRRRGVPEEIAEVTSPAAQTDGPTKPIKEKSTTDQGETTITPTTPTPAIGGLSEWSKVLLYSGIPALVVACCIAAILIRFKRRRSKASDETLFIRYLENGSADKPPTPKIKRPSIDFAPRDPAFESKEFDRSLLKIEKELGAGQFGIVYKAFAFGLNGVKEYVPVAVKSLRVSATPSMQEDFLNEIKLMIDLGPHPNILQIIGCCTGHEPFYLLTEYMKYGDLLHFLWKCREDKYRRQDSMFDLTPANQLQICRQIARGMEYIFKSRYYHGDLAARNVLVGEGLEVKISDFGLADDIYQSGYTRLAPDKKRPVKWVSLETNTIGRCTIQSDVWSFGIVMYEIYTLGGIPYPGMDGREIISKLQDGYRMPKPEQCPDDIYDIMRACWHANPSERPTFTAIFKRLDDMLAVDSDYLTAETEDVQKFTFATAPSRADSQTDNQTLAGDDMKLSTMGEGDGEAGKKGDEEEGDEGDGVKKLTDTVTMDMDTVIGQKNHGFEMMEDEECSVSIKKDAILDQGRGRFDVVS